MSSSLSATAGNVSASARAALAKKQIKLFLALIRERSARRLLLLEKLVGGFDQADFRMRGAVFAELFRLCHQLIGIDQRRLVLLFVIAVEPGEDNADVFLARVHEFVAAPRREVDILGESRRGQQQRAGDQERGLHAIPLTLSNLSRNLSAVKADLIASINAKQIKLPKSPAAQINISLIDTK